MAIFDFLRETVFPTKLKANCLLTRYPIFVLKKDPWGGVTRYIKAHGYDVREVASFDLIKGHLIVREELPTFSPNAVSVTVVKENLKFQTYVPQRRAKAFRPVTHTYQGDSPRQFFLQHCIFLAEYDLTTAK